MINFTIQKYQEAKAFIASDKLNALEFVGSTIWIVSALTMALAYNSSDVWFIIGAIGIATGFITDVLVYVIEEIRMGSPVWHEAFGAAVQEEEDKERLKDILSKHPPKQEGEGISTPKKKEEPTDENTD